MFSIKVAKVSAILNRSNTSAVVKALHQAGFNHIYLQDARTPIINTDSNLISFLTGKGALFSRPTKIVSVYVHDKHAQDVIALMANEGQLRIPGMGSVYSETMHLYRHYDGFQAPKLVFPHYRSSPQTFRDLIGISCVVGRGDADYLARIILESGLGIPSITFGTGTGLRQKIGLLRITIPAEKETLSLVVSKWDAIELVETLIAVGRLHLPGRGFINTFPIEQGLINLKASIGRKYHAASMEQVIGAIDGLSGGMEWRRNQVESTESAKKRSYLDGTDIHVLCNLGSGVKLVKRALRAGAGGATVDQLRMTHPSNDLVSPARERVKMMVKHEQIHAVIEAMVEGGALGQDHQAIIFCQDVPKAFTYLRKSS